MFVHGTPFSQYGEKTLASNKFIPTPLILLHEQLPTAYDICAKAASLSNCGQVVVSTKEHSTWTIKRAVFGGSRTTKDMLVLKVNRSSIFCFISVNLPPQ